MIANDRGTAGPPLSGLVVVELGGLGPVPFAGMLLADLGATVIVLDKPGTDSADVGSDPLRRGKASLVVDLKADGASEMIVQLCRGVDIVLEGFRPGVAERLGVGPVQCQIERPDLVYGRMTGFGQTGPLSQVAGHDVNFISYAGVLAHLGPPDAPPTLPLNLIADYAGGGFLLALGVLAANREAQSTGQGDVVDAAMVDGSALLMTAYFGWSASGFWGAARGMNAFDGGSPFVNVYETSDHRYVSFGAVEGKFYDAMVATLGLDASTMYPQADQAQWGERKLAVADAIRSRSRDEWRTAFEGVEACFSPVLAMSEAAEHAHARERASFVEIGGVLQPAPAPRFAHHPTGTPLPPTGLGVQTRQTLRSIGATNDQIDLWARNGLLRPAEL